MDVVPVTRVRLVGYDAKMPNRLANETSPYLLQHQNNPVDWYPWGDEALARAKREDKPIFLSIGYSACHWCHVMEHESFENPAIAAELNARFVCIKVDREERPDLDQIYMNAVQLMTGRGGWPMSVFLTPDLQPFYGGTYWPDQPRMGMPGFGQVVLAVDDAWKKRRDQAIAQAAELTAHLQDAGEEADSGRGLRIELLQQTTAVLERVFDATHGGFGRAPKFPHPMDLQLLLRVWRRWNQTSALRMVKVTLNKMAGGGIYDHLAGGFARYSVDERWLVPHFEKMLYDNALLANTYLDAYLATGEREYRRITEETCDYILKYMTDAEGPFHSTEDADSEGEEGKFYVWTPSQIRELLGESAAERFCFVYDVTEHGNFEHGKSILNLPKSIAECASLKHWDLAELESELAESRRKLLESRDQRVRPGKDDKVLVSWNSLMIDAMARAAVALDRPEYLAAARRAAEFLLFTVRRPDGHLLHSWRLGQAKFDGYLDDYSYFINGLVSLYEADFDERWIEEAVRLADLMLRHFSDFEGGGFFFTADDHEKLITRQKDLHDASVPSGNAMAATALVRLGKLCGREDYLAAARGTLKMALGVMERSPTAAGQMLIALDRLLGPTTELVVVGEPESSDTKAAIRAIQKSYLPNSVVAFRPTRTKSAAAPQNTNEPVRSEHLASLFTGREESKSPTLFVCQNFVCEASVTGLPNILERLKSLSAEGSR